MSDCRGSAHCAQEKYLFTLRIAAKKTLNSTAPFVITSKRRITKRSLPSSCPTPIAYPYVFQRRWAARIAASSARRASSRLSGSSALPNRRPILPDQKRSEAYATNLLFMGMGDRWPITPSLQASDGFRLRRHRHEPSRITLSTSGLIRNYARVWSSIIRPTTIGQSPRFEPARLHLRRKWPIWPMKSRITATISMTVWIRDCSRRATRGQVRLWRQARGHRAQHGQLLMNADVTSS